nr:MAG TPA: hypothetical protein [Caudoviricetes sp.]
MNKNQEFFDGLKNVMKAINAVKKTMRCKKSCYDNCTDEKIKKIFIEALRIDLLRLDAALNDWENNEFLRVEGKEND